MQEKDNNYTLSLWIRKLLLAQNRSCRHLKGENKLFSFRKQINRKKGALLRALVLFHICLRFWVYFFVHCIIVDFSCST